jgi:hypothetical protein
VVAIICYVGGVGDGLCALDVCASCASHFDDDEHDMFARSSDI